MTGNINSIGTITAVCCNPQPGLPKPVVEAINLIKDWGVEGDYHAGRLVRHRYLAKKYPTRPNIRQVLLVDAKDIEELAQENIAIEPGMLGENITVEGLALMQLPVGTRLAIGEAVLEVSEVRTPCKQLNGIHSDLLKAVTSREHSKKKFRAGIMTRILKGGTAKAGDQVHIVSHNELAQQLPLL